MPRGFLVKRNKNSTAYSYRHRHYSDDERSEGSSDQEYFHTNFGSPDSGYCASPVSLALKEKENIGHYERDLMTYSPPSTSLCVRTDGYPSPLYFTTFDRLCVSSSSENSPNQIASRLAPDSPNKKRVNPETGAKLAKTPKKPKAARKINFDEDKSSPVSGTIIKDLSDSEEEGKVIYGDIDSAYNYVEITPEAKAELDKIENKIGDYICQLCKEHYHDAFQLAQHRCSRIVHVEYRCPECDKVFNCPANLASHRRWHKPRPNAPKPAFPARILPANGIIVNEITNINGKVENGHPDNDEIRASPTEDGQYECETCGKKFRRQAYLRKHLLNHVNELQLPCQYCGKIFVNENARAKHESQHSSNNKGVSCTVCNTSFQNKISLEKHMRTHTSEVYTCKFCSSSFYTSPGLTRHINKCHPSENRQVILLQIPVNRPR